MSLAFVVSACGPHRAFEPQRNVAAPLDPEAIYAPDEAEAEKYVDYASGDLSACQWQAALEKQYTSSSGRFRLFGQIELRKPPETFFNPLTIIGQLASLVDFVLPWNMFRGIDIPNLSIRPWGRIDMRANSLNSYAFLTEAASQIPDREQFLRKVDQVLALRPSQYLKLLAFKAGLLTRTINATDKRNEVVQEELEKVFPGLFSPDETRDLLESFSWVLARNGLRQKSGFKNEDLQIFSKNLPVFRAGGWNALAADMRLGLGAAVVGVRSGSPHERACAANIIFRSTDQLLQLMGQETLPLLDTSKGQSYVPSLEGLLTARDATTIRHCNSVGSVLRNDKRVRLDESTLSRLSEISDRYDWNEKPLPLSYCKPEQTSVAGDIQTSSDPEFTALDAILARIEAFGHYLFAFNPAAIWWKQSPIYPLGAFAGLKDIQDQGSLAPMRVHALSLAYLQFNLLHFQNRHLVFLDENGVRTLDKNQAYGIRLSDAEIGRDAVIAKSSLRSVLKWAELLAKFDRYLLSVETWSKSSQASSSRVNGLFVSRTNLKTLIGPSGENRKNIHKLYLATSLLLLKYVDRDDPTHCARQIVTDLATGGEEMLGDCAELRPQLASALRKLAIQLNSPLLKRTGDTLDPAKALTP
ncbi:MAG: hypothetical protein ABIR96_06190 [Bdellovibrionota bacterium]